MELCKADGAESNQIEYLLAWVVIALEKVLWRSMEDASSGVMTTEPTLVEGRETVDSYKAISITESNHISFSSSWFPSLVRVKSLCNAPGDSEVFSSPIWDYDSLKYLCFCYGCVQTNFRLIWFSGFWFAWFVLWDRMCTKELCGLVKELWSFQFLILEKWSPFADSSFHKLEDQRVLFTTLLKQSHLFLASSKFLWSMWEGEF